MRVAVIGAGMAGLSCAARLRTFGHQVEVFEKSRGLGGRLSTRRAGALRFDHGAQFATARDADFLDLMQQNQVDRIAAPWTSPGTGTGWWVGRPGMSALVGRLSLGLDISLNTRITTLNRHGSLWSLEDETTRRHTDFDAVIVTVPGPQAEALLRPVCAPLAEAAARMAYEPCWTLMMAFEERLPLKQDVIAAKTEHMSWIARDSAKPDRVAGADCWVVQASPTWSRAHLEDTAEVTAERMAGMLADRFGFTLPRAIYQRAHRWRYARVERALETPCMFDPDLMLGLAGDACLAARVEAAFLSGRAAAEALISAR
ncbi:NAD(P)/FAD-dependent oxidoreductase [Maricaulis sp. D1M11]|uniref:NAD(P)/FAD-dependent oxidoreductase n=1 Tax=Maricaulis sp. D1M11 TaxID=3076117 RepID=UPI0039B640A3